MAVRTLSEIQDIVSRLARQYGAKRIYLFGSYARGDMNEDGDIDLRIVRAQSKDCSWQAFSLIWKTLLECPST